jgi:hypothetical protein
MREKDGEYEDTETDTTAWNTSNFFCLRAPYHYLQCWLDRESLPPRQTAFPLEPDMSFEGEFYEVVNYMAGGRGMFILVINRWKELISLDDVTGTLGTIDYEGIEDTHAQCQDNFIEGFSGAYELGIALQAGLRGKDLIPALLRDFQVWQTCPADRYAYALPNQTVH